MTTPLKITHIIPFLSKGGAEKVAVELANHAAEMGHSVTLLVSAPVDPTLLQYSVDTDIKIQFISHTTQTPLKRILSAFYWLWHNQEWLWQQNIIHCHLTYGSVVGTFIKILRSIVKKKKTLVVETYHAVGMGIPKLKRWIHARLAVHNDGLIFMAKSDYWGNFIDTHPKLVTKIIPNGISLNAKDTPTKETKATYLKEIGNLENCCLIVGTVGMLREDRKPWLLIPVFAEISKIMGENIHFLVAGQGPEMERMKSLSIEHGIKDQLHLPGTARNPQLPFSFIDLYLTMNIGPITGIAALEAGLSGCPIIAIQLSETYQQKRDDWIWASKDPIKIANKIVELLKSTKNRQELANRQHKYIQSHYTTSVMANAYYEFYQEINTKLKLRKRGV